MFEPRSPRSDLLGALASGFIVIGFCLILLRHDPLVFWNDDYEISVLPVFADVARSWSQGHLPLLSPYSWVCGNLAGEYQYGTFSIFVNAAVVLIWKFPLTFSQQAAALSITHLFVLAAGGFLLARGRALSIPLSTFVGLIAALNGWLICWGSSDWFGALGAFAWLPWAWWGLEKSVEVAVRSGQSTRMPPGTAATTKSLHYKQLIVAALWPPFFVYLLVTGGFPYTVVMLALLIAWLSIKCLIHTKNLMSVLPMLFGAALGFGLSAPAWLAIFDYVNGSAREMQSASAHWQWIVPPAAWPGLILPSWTVNWTDFSSRNLPHTATELACGLVAPSALIAGLLWRPRLVLQRMGWELALLALVLVLAMLPTAGLFRWSFRWLPLFYLTLALCAAEVLGHSRALNAWQRLPWSATPATTALALIGVTAIAMFFVRTGGAFAFPFTWIVAGIAAGWVMAELLLHNSAFAVLRAWLPASVTLAVFAATYICIPTNCGVPKYNLDQKLLRPAPLDPRRLYLSVYPPPEYSYRTELKPLPVGQVVRPGSTSMWAGLRLINGYSPIIPAGVGREWKCAIHGEIDQWVGRYLLEEQAGAGAQLDRMGVDGIVVASEFDFAPKPDSEWGLVAASDEGRVYHRHGVPFARVRSMTSIESRPNKSFVLATVSQIDDSRNRVEADVDVPSGGSSALLTFSRPYFRGYEAHLGNRKLRVDSYRGLFPVVELPSGSYGRLILSYRPWWLAFGSALSLSSAVFFVIAGVIVVCRRNHSFVIRNSSFDIR
jgi:hypothetical protein